MARDLLSTSRFLTDALAARDVLVSDAGWSPELAARLDPGLAGAIAVARETGLEGFNLPIILQAPSGSVLHDSVTSKEAIWGDYIRSLADETRSILANIIAQLRDRNIAVRHVLNFTTSLSFKSSEDDLKTILSSSADASVFAWLNAPGELELNVGRRTVHVEDLSVVGDLDGDEQVVAVLDGEVDISHPGLHGRVERKGNFSDSAWDSSGIADSLAKDHGTKVGVIVAGDGNANGGGQSPRGIAPRAKIWNYRIAPLIADGSSVAAALEQACIDGARIANLSWGQSKAALDGNSVWARTVDVAFTKGMLTVKSVGNSGPAAGSLTTPADAANVLSVGATNREGTQIHEKCSRGPTTVGAAKPELVAPGGGMHVTSASGVEDIVAVPGTSFAAPVVSGIAALALQKNPNWSIAELRSALIAACAPVAGASAEVQGAGLIDARRILEPGA